MTIQLPEPIERSIWAAVQTGRFPSIGEAVTAAWLAFEEQVRQSSKRPALTVEEFQQQLLAEGIISHLPDPALDTDDDEPVVIAGEPLSEAIIRERR